MKRLHLYCLLAFCLLLLSPLPAAAQKYAEVFITVRTSPESDFQTTLSIQSREKLGEKILQSKKAAATHPPDLPQSTIQVKNRQYVFDSCDRLFDAKTHEEILLPANVRASLHQWVEKVKKAHFGSPMLWEQVKTDFRRMAFAEVIDLETGKRFRVQRRAGSQHADVQPLTSTDTKTMKEIYQGKWSWKRRAILLHVNGTKYAASMHGMPHGAGAIRGNNFPGHFCIHFKGSSTHRHPEPDPGHSFMIMKAAGQLDEEIKKASPQLLVDYFLTALREQDFSTLAKTVADNELALRMQDILYLKPLEDERDEGIVDVDSAIIPAKITYVQKGSNRKHNETWIFWLKRSSPLDRWKIADIVTEN